MKRQSIFIVAFVALLFAIGCTARSTPEVAVYCAQDQVFAEPIFEAFTARTGIAVRARWDVESAKTTGLVNALVAEKANPRCDVFWNGEMAQTLYLQEQGALEPYKTPARDGIPAEFLDPDGAWTAIAARAHIILYNTDHVRPDQAPRSVLDLTDKRWRGRVAIALPIFGTSLTHAAALFQLMGDAKARAFFEALQANDVIVAEGNAHVRDLVAAGQAWVGLTDTDDACGALRAGKPVAVVFPDASGMGTLLVPNTVMLIRGGPHPETGRKLVDYLCSREVEEQLARGESAQLPLHVGLEGPPQMPGLAKAKPMKIDYAALGRNIPEVSQFLRERFLR